MRILTKEELININDYWNAANYLSVGQLYLLDNPLLKRKLSVNDVKEKVVGHWGTDPGQNFIYVHLNRIIKKRQLLSKNIGKKKYLYNCKFQFKTKYSLNEIFIFIKILYFFILILFSNIYKIKIFNNEKEIYYSHTKYKIYNKIFKKKCLKKINFGIYNPTLSNGGRERITALLITYLFKVNIFNIYLFTRTRKNKYEYQVPENTIRIQTFGSRDLINKFNKK